MKHIHNVTLQKTANFSVYNIVADLRRQRMAMVQTKVLCYQSLFFPVMIYCVDQGPGRDLSSGQIFIHRIEIYPRDRHLSTGQRFNDRVEIYPWVTDFSTGWEIIHGVEIYPLGRDLSTGQRFIHRVEIYPPNSDLSTEQRFIHRIAIYPMSLIQVVFRGSSKESVN